MAIKDADRLPTAAQQRSRPLSFGDEEYLAMLRSGPRLSREQKQANLEAARASMKNFKPAEIRK